MKHLFHLQNAPLQEHFRDQTHNLCLFLLSSAVSVIFYKTAF